MILSVRCPWCERIIGVTTQASRTRIARHNTRQFEGVKCPGGGHELPENYLAKYGCNPGKMSA